MVAARSYALMRAIASDKKLIGASYNIGFGSFQMRIEANVASYATKKKSHFQNSRPERRRKYEAGCRKKPSTDESDSVR
jgi:hypothetical protein